MKTRKVGKIVSLLVAIVLVATIMIPAASVLAQPAEGSGSAADYKGTWTEVDSFTALNDAIEAANNAPEGSAAKTVHIRLTEDITCLTPHYNSGDLYVYSKTRLMKRSGQTGYAIEERLQDRWTETTWDRYKERGHEASWLVSQPGLFDVSDPSSPFYGLTADDFVNGFVVTKAMQDAVGMGNKGGVGMSTGVTGKTTNDPAFDEKIGNEYSERMLIVESGTNVTIDLNSHNISAGGTNIFVSEPNAQMSVFIVRGTLTIADLNKTVMENGSLKVGAITGGTGNVYYDETIQNKSYSEIYRVAMFDENWNVLSIPDAQKKAVFGVSWAFSVGKWRIYFLSHSEYVGKNTVKESRGGGVYVENGGTLNLESGKITGNCAYMNSGEGLFASKVDSYTKGGGVFVEAGGKFLMSGGEVSGNASRAYQKSGATNDAYAYGGGVYLEGAQGETAGAEMYMSGGKIAENATYSQVASSGQSAKSARAYGGGIYVGEGAVCSIIGNDVEEEKTDLAMVKTFPQITNNSCGAVAQRTSAANPDVTIQGGGIYNGGTLNLKNALVTANDFAEGDNDLPNSKAGLTISKATRVKRDAESGLALYVKSYNADGTPASYVTRLDDGFNENLELATEQVEHGTTGVYGTMIGNEEMGLFSDGAGVCVRENAKLVVGERVWITDNYDLVTTGHKAFDSIRDYKRSWQQTKSITDDRVVKTNDDGTGVSYTDPAGGYVYDSTRTAPDTNAVYEGVSYTDHIMDGYAFSDTTDDVYLPEGEAIYKGGSLYETKIGVNYWNMVNADGTVVDGGLGQAGNRVIVKAGKDLTSVDPDGKLIWNEETATPTQRDIQFFYLNDNNKNWERFKNVSRNASNDYYDYDKNNLVPVYGYALPEYVKKGSVGYQLCDLNATNSSDFEDRIRVRVIDTDNSGINKDASPYEGYINYNVTYPVKRWADGQTASFSGYDVHKNGGYWKYYQKETYRISDPSWSPDNSDFRPKGGTLSNAIVNFPQRAYSVTSEMKNTLPESYLKAKYMDYKVVYDNSQFGKTEPVLRFGTYTDKESNDTIRKMFVTVNFDEAGKHYYGVSNSSIAYNNTTAASAQTDTFTTDNTAFANVDASALFYGADRVKGTINIAKIVPNYASYGKGDILADLRAASATADSSLSYDDAEKKNESTDLYFKGWKYYTSYGDGPRVETLSNSDDERTIEGTSLSHRGYFSVDLANIFNPNINSQPCPSLTATWYTKEELAAARQNLSACKAQLILGTDGHIYIRVISVLGAYGEDRYNLQPIQASDANSSLRSLYYNAPTFVASKLNATPTLEGGYKATVNKGNIAAENYSARVVKKIICNDDEKNTFTIDIYDYISGNVSDENDIWVKFVNSNAAYKNANNSKSTTYVSFMWTNIDTGLTLADISNGSGYSDAAQEVLFVTPCIELTTDKAGNDHNSYYYGASRGFSIASLDAKDGNKLLEQAKTATN